MLAWIDAAAAGYAMQLCDTPRMVTISIDKCFFEKPAKEGSLVKIYGTPHKVGPLQLLSIWSVELTTLHGEQKLF